MFATFNKSGDQITILSKSTSSAKLHEELAILYQVEPDGEDMQLFNLPHNETVGFAPFVQIIDGVSKLPIIWSEVRIENSQLVEHLLHEGRDLPLNQQIDFEADRRIELLVSERRAGDIQRRMLELLNKGKTKWTDAEKTEVAAIETGNQYVNAVRLAAATLISTDPIPQDFKADEHWPAMSAPSEAES